MSIQAYRHPSVAPLAMETTGAVRKYRIVKVSGDNTIAECNSEEMGIGTSLEAATATGDVIEIQPIGPIAKAEAGGSISAGDLVNADADGKIVTEAADTKIANGIALHAADNGDIISIMLTIVDVSA